MQVHVCSGPISQSKLIGAPSSEMVSFTAHVVELALQEGEAVRTAHVTAYVYSDNTSFWSAPELVKAVLPGRHRKPSKLWDAWCGAACRRLHQCGLPDDAILQLSKQTRRTRQQPFTDKTREVQTASTSLLLISTLLQGKHAGTMSLRRTSGRTLFNFQTSSTSSTSNLANSNLVPIPPRKEVFQQFCLHLQ
eukprot:1390198-Amphidinium_carterae.2